MTTGDYVTKWAAAPVEGVERGTDDPPAETIPAFDNSLGWDAIIKWAYANSGDGVVAVRDIAREFVDWRTRAQSAETRIEVLEAALTDAMGTLEEAVNAYSYPYPEVGFLVHDALALLRAALAAPSGETKP